MLSTLTDAHFFYRGYIITAHRIVDTASGKFFCWFGEFNDETEIAHRSLQQFEKIFRQTVDEEIKETRCDPTTQA